ncbi:zinc finger and SCAN domain-containing protein 20 [Anolis carolinensis]|uniref:zinc finger and SCAN domain-containing protein 20 n=1 Tax=Anolis carolinensis TaxID=28377 RepID=UPI002F2B2BB5
MQVEQESLSQLGLCIEAVEYGEEGQNGGQTLCLAQLGEPLNWTTLEQPGLDAEERLAQSWEVQWHDVPKAVPQWESPKVPKTMRWEVSKSALVPSEVASDFSPASQAEAAVILSPEVLRGQDTGDGQGTNTEDVASTEVRRQCFRLFRYKEEEGPRQVCGQLHNLCCRWLTPESCTKEQILDQLILEQFLTVLPLEMQSWVREGSPESCHQAVALAEDFLRGQQEAERWEGQELLAPAEVSVSFSATDEAASELYTEVKQEVDNGDGPRSLGSDELLVEYNAARGELEVYNVNTVEPETHVEPSQMENWNKTVPDETWEELLEISLPQLEMQTNDAYTDIRKNLSQTSNLKRPQLIHTGPKLHICTMCGHSFTRRANLFRHQQLHTGLKLHRCTVCNRSFTRRENLVRHLRTHKACGKYTVQNKGDLLQVTLEGTEASEKENQGGQKLKEPSGIWKSKSVLDQESGACFDFVIPQTGHQEGTGRNVCPVCGKSFTRRTTLNRHQRIVHTSEGLNKCTDCGKSLDQAAPAGGKPCRCAKCDERNSLNLSLRNYKRSHKGKKRFKCLDCDRGFSCHSHLLRHMRIHTGEKPYFCSACGKTFRQMAHLVKHQRSHGDQEVCFC